MLTHHGVPNETYLNIAGGFQTGKVMPSNHGIVGFERQDGWTDIHPHVIFLWEPPRVGHDYMASCSRKCWKRSERNELEAGSAILVYWGEANGAQLVYFAQNDAKSKY